MTLYLSDLDGTLLKKDASLSELTVRKINSLLDKGVLFSYATARSFASAAPLVERLRLTCPAVIFNGVFVVLPKSGRHIAENIFSKNAAKIARDFIRENDLAPLVYSFIDGNERVSYLAEKQHFVQGYLDLRRGDKRLRAARDYAELFAGNMFYMTVLNAENTSKLDAFFTAENGFATNFQRDTYDDSTWYEIYDKNAGKAAAALQVKALVGADEMVCFGDNKNDISMIKAAEIGAAVGNSCSELKRFADIIIEDNERDGVAKFIENREQQRG